MSDLPYPILQKAIQLRNHLKQIYIALYTLNQPATAQEVANLVEHERAYVHTKLLELVDMKFARKIREGNKVKFEVIE